MSKIKICGLSRIEDITAVNGALPDYIGFVFAPSRRRIDAQSAAALKERLDVRIKAVGVFVNEKAETVAELCRRGIIDLAQLHGDEDAGYIARLKELCGCPVIKAVGVGAEPPLLPPCGSDYLLFDTLSERRGGTGKVFNWSLIKNITDRPYFLAGGLSPENVSDAIKALKPYCADVSGGVETGGVKDAEKIDKFVRNCLRGMSF